MFLGVVGKPNVGKSTFFKASTLMDVEIANYPFATIKPNTGVGFVRIECVDKDFNKQCNPREGYCKNGIRFVPVKMTDVAGLVPGAYEGKGMGNQFLDDLRDADCLIHVIDASGGTNEKGESVLAGSYDPANDIKFLEFELDMWFFNIFKKVWDKFSRCVSQEHQDPIKAIAKQFTGLKVNENMVKDSIRELNLLEKSIINWSEEELKKLVMSFRKKTKPIIIAANKIDHPVAQSNLERLKKEFPDHIIIGCSAESELALKEATKHKMIDYLPGDKNFSIIGNLNENQRKALDFIKSNVLDKFGSSGVQKILDSAVFDILKYIAIFPGGVNKLTDQHGNTLPDCFLMPPNTTALDFAYRLHTDFGKNFIKAINVKTKLPVGRDYLLQNRDVIEIMSK
jgi:ribosome-binding ATPase